MSKSETNLYYTDVEFKHNVGPSTKSTPSNSYLSVYAEVNFNSKLKWEILIYLYYQSNSSRELKSFLNIQPNPVWLTL